MKHPTIETIKGNVSIWDVVLRDCHKIVFHPSIKKNQLLLPWQRTYLLLHGSLNDI